eukprot:jgi/Mesvir1/11580/Mv04342-RA.1
MGVIDVDLIQKWDDQNGKCAITGISMIHEYDKQGRRMPCSAAMDLIDPSLGFCAQNVRLVCSFVHDMKGSLPLTVFVEYCKLVTDNAAAVKADAVERHVSTETETDDVDEDDDLPVAKEARWSDQV